MGHVGWKCSQPVWRPYFFSAMIMKINCRRRVIGACAKFNEKIKNPNRRWKWNRSKRIILSIKYFIYNIHLSSTLISRFTSQFAYYLTQFHFCMSPANTCNVTVMNDWCALKNVYLTLIKSGKKKFNKHIFELCLKWLLYDLPSELSDG